jgi:hypothetical protein
MQVEGKGAVAPKPRKLLVDNSVVRRCAEWAESCARMHGYDRSSDEWAKGTSPPVTLIGNISCDSWFSGLALGKVAEWYVCEMFGAKPDMEFRRGGDGGVDLAPSWLPCGPAQIKNSRTLRPMLVKQGSREQRRCEWFIATHWSGVDSHVSVLGWASKSQVNAADLVPGKNSKWMNRRVPLCDLHSIQGLLTLQRVSEVL